MIEEFDKLQMTFDDAKRLSLEERKERARQREELLAKMSNEELNELLKRPYPSQFKVKIRKYLK